MCVLRNSSAWVDNDSELLWCRSASIEDCCELVAQCRGKLSGKQSDKLVAKLPAASQQVEAGLLQVRNKMRGNNEIISAANTWIWARQLRGKQQLRLFFPPILKPYPLPALFLFPAPARLLSLLSLARLLSLLSLLTLLACSCFCSCSSSNCFSEIIREDVNFGVKRAAIWLY
jgi:hypothetical protein